METGPLVDQLLDRVRDPQGTAHSRDVVRRVLTHAQRVVNAQSAAVLVERKLLVGPVQLIYPLSGIDWEPDIVRIEGIRVGERHLPWVSWDALTQADRRWVRKFADVPRVFSTRGRDLFILYPGPQRRIEITLVYSKVTETLDQDTDEIELPDELVPRALDLAESLLLLRSRMMTMTAPAAERFAGRV